MSESINYRNIKETPSTVYVIQEIAGTRDGRPKINIMGASQYGSFKDYLLLTGDPAIIGVACSIASDMTNGKYNVLKWDKQERRYYPIAINLYERGEINE